jgi:hypothetical protein
MDVGSDVLPVGIERAVAAVETHPNAERYVTRPPFRGECTLGVDRGPDRVGRAFEHRDERVALGLLLVTADGLDGRPDQFAMPCQERRPALATEILGELRRAFDVREQECDGPDRLRLGECGGALVSDAVAPSRNGPG